LEARGYPQRGLLRLSEDKGQIPKIEDSALKNEADGQPRYRIKAGLAPVPPRIN
jgi:hypothetical protein